MLKGSVFINDDEIFFIRRKSQKKSYWHYRLPPPLS